MMIYGLIPQELHQQLLDQQNYQSRTSGVEELKMLLLELDLQQLPSACIADFIQFLRRLLDDNNFKVLHGALQLLSLLVQKLGVDVERYYKEIAAVTVRALGDSRSVARQEYMSVFQQLMRAVGPQRVLDLLLSQLRHRNSRVREDAINIITAAMLTHPRKDFDIPSLCLEAAPALVDSKRKVRHAALELFAVLDYCLDTGKKQPLMRAVERVELTADAQGLMAAVQARRARHILPRLSADGTLEYALALPRPGHRRLPQLGSGADLDWVLNGGRVHSSRGTLTSADADQESAPQRRIASAGRGKNKLPWERAALSGSRTTPEQQQQVSSEDSSSSSSSSVRLHPDSGAKHSPLQSPGRTHRSVGRQRRSGSLDSDPEIFKMNSTSDPDKGFPKSSRFPSGSVERTFSLPTNSTPPGSFLLPSFPLTPAVPRRNPADATHTLTSTHTWPSRGDPTGELSSSKRSPLPPGAPRVSSVRHSRDMQDEMLDREEMLNSLRSLRNSAAKKRAKVSVSSSEADPDSPQHTPPSVSSPLSDSGLSPVSSAAKGKLSTSPAADITAPGVSQQDQCVCESSVSVVGQRVCFSRALDAEEQKVSEVSSSPQVRAAGREPLRALRPAKGAPQHVSKSCGLREMSEGVIGRGVFGSAVLPSRPSVSASPEQSDAVSRADPPSGVYGHAFSSKHTDSDASPEPQQLQEKVKLCKFASEKMRQRRVEQQEPIKRDDTHDEDEDDDVKDVNMNGCESPSDESPSSPNGPIKSMSPAHQPAPPTGPPNRNTVPRLRRASSLNRSRPAATHSCDELVSGSPKKESQDQLELRPFSKPELALTQSFRLTAADDWEKKIEGMNMLRSLAQYHPDVLMSRIHDVCLALIQEVRNLRSGVSRVAVVTLGEMFASLQKGMDQELDGPVRALLHKAGESNGFIRTDVERALDSLTQHCTHTRCIHALLAGGLGHLNAAVRRCTAHHLSVLLERVGAARLLSGAKDVTERLLPAVAKLAQDSSQEARYFGRRMLLFLSSHRDFDKMMEKFIPAKDLPALRDAVFTLKTKGLGEMPQDAPSARGRRSLTGSGLVRTSSLTRDPLTASRDPSLSKACAHSLAERSEYVKQMKTLLNSRDFRERMKAIDQLVCDCEENPALVIGSLFPVFDCLKARLQESNSKVNLRALEALHSIITLLRDHLSPVLNILIPALVDNHLNSKNTLVYTAALAALQALTHNIDNSLLLQPFCSKAQYLSGKAKLDLIEKVAEVVCDLYPRRPQLVEQKTLPLLWTLLGSCSAGGGGSLRAATLKLTEALHTHMGTTLLELAAAQSTHTLTDLNQLLRHTN